MKYFLAPLAEYTDAAFRRICFEGGADMAYTEMVSAAALFHGSSPTRHLMETMEGEGPVTCQIFGSGEDEVAFAAREAAALRGPGGGPRFCGIDLNAGCPMPRIMNAGCGACLVTKPERIYALVKAIRGASDLPVSVKTRLGPRPGENTVFELLDAAERAGASRFAIHARYTSQMHGGPVSYDVLADAVARAKIPVAGNGGVRTPADAARMAETGVDAVMVGRAAFARPSIFAALRAAERGEPEPEIPWPEGPALRHFEYLLEFRRLLCARYPDDHVPGEDAFASVKMHTHFVHYIKGIPGAASVRARLNTIRTLAEVRAILASLSEAPENGEMT